MSPATRVPRTLAALALAAAGLTTTGCAGLPWLTPSQPISPPIAPPVSESPSPEPQSSEPQTPEPSPSRTRSATPGSEPTRTTRPSTTKPATPRPSASSYNPPPDGDDIQNGYIPRATVEIKIQKLIREKTGKNSYVSCPGNLTAKVGEKMLCNLKSLDGKPTTNQVELSVTSIEGRQVQYFAKIV